eukprot:gene23629-9158_t
MGPPGAHGATQGGQPMGSSGAGTTHSMGPPSAWATHSMGPPTASAGATHSMGPPSARATHPMGPPIPPVHAFFGVPMMACDMSGVEAPMHDGSNAVQAEAAGGHPRHRHASLLCKTRHTIEGKRPSSLVVCTADAGSAGAGGADALTDAKHDTQWRVRDQAPWLDTLLVLALLLVLLVLECMDAWPRNTTPRATATRHMTGAQPRAATRPANVSIPLVSISALDSTLLDPSRPNFARLLLIRGPKS